MSYVNTFGGQPQNPSPVTYADVTLTADTQYYWPWSGVDVPEVAAKINNVTASAGPFRYILPPGDQAGPGEAAMFYNVGVNSFDVYDSQGGAVASVAAGAVKFVYLTDNSTEAGSWSVFTFGTGSSGADASALAGAGLLAISNTLNEQFTVSDFSGSGTTINSAARAIMYNWTGGSGTLNIADPTTLGTGWFTGIKNSGSGTLTVMPAAGTIDGSSSKNFNPGDAAFIIRNGSDLITVGYGQSVAFSFNYIAINVAGSGNFTLNAAQQNKIAYKFTGLLTGNREIIVPATVQQYWPDNSTTGAFDLSVRTAAQASPGVALMQNTRGIFYCDGTNIVDAVTASGGISTPVSIADGGTGATTASGARSNLGATSVGEALFTAASTAAGRTALALGTIATQNSNAVAITGGTIAGLTSLSSGPVAISDAENGLTVSSTTDGENSKFVTTDAGAIGGPGLALQRISASPAASDGLGYFIFYGADTAGTLTTPYVQILASILDPTDGSEDGGIRIRNLVAGTVTTTLTLGPGLLMGAATGGDKGLGTVNATGYYLNGTALATSPFVGRAYTEYTTNADLSVAIPEDDTIPTSSEGTQILSQSITTTTATQRVRVEFSGYTCGSSLNPIVAIFRGTTCIQTTIDTDYAATSIHPISSVVEEAPGSAAAFTYSVRVGPNGSTIRMNGTTSGRLFGGSSRATLVLTLIEP